MNAQRVSIELALLALEVDRLAVRVAEEGRLSDGDAVLFAAPTMHLRLAVEQLEDALYESTTLSIAPWRLTT